jgi:hypothetical protein
MLIWIFTPKSLLHQWHMRMHASFYLCQTGNNLLILANLVSEKKIHAHGSVTLDFSNLVRLSIYIYFFWKCQK